MRNHHLLILACGVFSFLLPVQARVASAVVNLCDEGLEGSYTGKMGGNVAVRLNLICLDGKRMVASFADQSPTSMMVNLPFLDFDEDKLVIAVASLKGEDRRKISSQSRFTYLKLGLASLRSREPRGVFFQGNVKSFLPISLHKTQIFPKLKPASDLLSKNAVTGVYKTTIPGIGSGILLADIIFDAPFFSLQLSNGPSLFAIDSLHWDGSGLISSISVEGDGESDEGKFLYLRGRFVSEKIIEYYMVTPSIGIQGPFKAIKDRFF